MARKYKWIKGALGTKRRLRGRKARGYTPKLHRHHRHFKSERVEAEHKGALHEWAHHRLGWSLDRKFSLADIHRMERIAREDHEEAETSHERERTLHALRMVLFAKNVHGLRHHRGHRRAARGYAIHHRRRHRRHRTRRHHGRHHRYGRRAR